MAGIIPLTFHVPARAPTSKRIIIGVLMLFMLENIFFITKLILIFSESPMLVATLDVKTNM